MNYIWDENDLRKRKNELLQIKKIKNNKALDPILLENDLQLLNEMLCRLHSKTSDFTVLEKPEIVKKDLMKLYKNTPKFIKNLLLGTWKIISRYDLDIPLDKIPTQFISDEDLVTLSHDFYRWIPNKNYVQLVEHYTNKDVHLLFIKNHPGNAFYGLAFSIYFPIYTPYILLMRENTIADVITLNHELSHSVYNIFDRNRPHYLKELEGYTYDYLSLEFLSEQSIIDESTKKILMETFFDEAIYKFFEFFLTFFLSRTRYHFQERALDYQIIHKFPCNIPSDLDMTITYILSFLTFLDLDFETDREKAFYTFEKIRTHGNLSYKFLEKNGITFMNDGYQNLQKSMQKLHLTK